MNTCLPVIHAEQPDGTWVATCEEVPGWLCFGESLEATKTWAEHTLLKHVADRTMVVHYTQPHRNAA